MVFQLLRSLERPGTIAKQSRAAHRKYFFAKKTERSLGGHLGWTVSNGNIDQAALQIESEMRTSIAGCRLVKRGRRGISHSEANPVVVVMESWRVRVAAPSWSMAFCKRSRTSVVTR